jgi:hypothetical protein
VVERRLANSFESAVLHARETLPATCPARLSRARATFVHAGKWATVMGGVYLFGHLRPAERAVRHAEHPSIAG